MPKRVSLNEIDGNFTRSEVFVDNPVFLVFKILAISSESFVFDARMEYC